MELQVKVIDRRNGALALPPKNLRIKIDYSNEQVTADDLYAIVKHQIDDHEKFSQ